MVADLYKWQELRAWAKDKARLGSEEDAVFFSILLAKMSQIDAANSRSKFSIDHGSLRDTYQDAPFDGEDF